MNINYQLKIFSINSKIKKNIEKILKTKNLEGFNKVNFINIPKKIKKFTLLKSPHVHKKSREQYESIQYKLIIETQKKSYIENLKNQFNTIYQGKLKYNIKYIIS